MQLGRLNFKSTFLLLSAVKYILYLLLLYCEIKPLSALIHSPNPGIEIIITIL